MYNENAYINGVSLKLNTKGELYYFDDERKVDIKILCMNPIETHLIYLVLKKKLRQGDLSYYKTYQNSKDCVYFDFNKMLKDDQKEELKGNMNELIQARKLLKSFLKKHVDKKETYLYNDIDQIQLKIKKLINFVY